MARHNLCYIHSNWTNTIISTLFFTKGSQTITIHQKLPALDTHFRLSALKSKVGYIVTYILHIKQTKDNLKPSSK